MKILVIAEHNNSELAEATRHAVTAAAQFGGEVSLLVAGLECDAVVSQAAALQGVARVLVAKAEHYRDQLAENLAVLVQRLVADEGLKAVVAPATSFGKNVTPRLAALLDVAPVSDVMTVVAPGQYIRPIYAGSVMVTVHSDEPVQVLTARTTAFDPAATGGSASVQDIAAAEDTGLGRLLQREIIKSERPELTSARIVVAGGRGLGSEESFKNLIEPLADSLGAAVGASRAAVDAGYIRNDHQIGQTGKIVAPELYIAVGISGAIQHIAGMKDSKTIVAINNDPDALIFQSSDYGLVGDLFEIVPALTAGLNA